MENKDSKTAVLVQSISMLIRGFEEQKKVKVISIDIKTKDGTLVFDSILEYDDAER